MFLIVLYFPLLLLASLLKNGSEKMQILGETENRFRNLADAAPIMIWVANTDKLCSFLAKVGSTSRDERLTRSLVTAGPKECTRTISIVVFGRTWNPLTDGKTFRWNIGCAELTANIDGFSITVWRASGPTASSSGIWVLPWI